MKIKKSILLVTTIALFLVSPTLGGNLLAQSNDLPTDPIDGLNKSAGEVTAFTEQVNNYNSDFLQTKAGQIIGTILSFVGVLFLILMIYAGILWMTAQGNENQVNKAKGLLVNGIVGLIIVFAAYAITSFIGGEILR
jgi:cbb3-type cytochrome oxidase subunit 3